MFNLPPPHDHHTLCVRPRRSPLRHRPIKSSDIQARRCASENRHRKLVRPEGSPSAAAVDSHGGAAAGLSAGGIFCAESCFQRRADGHARGVPRVSAEQLNAFRRCYTREEKLSVNVVDCFGRDACTKEMHFGWECNCVDNRYHLPRHDCMCLLQVAPSRMFVPGDLGSLLVVMRHFSSSCWAASFKRCLPTRCWI